MQFSFDGKHIGAVDALGRVYFFGVGEPNPVWVSSMEVTGGVISMSQASSVAVGGGDSSGAGRVLSISLEDGERLWEWRTASLVASVSMSSDDSTVVAPAPGIIYVGAASGSGIMKSDALSRIAASLYVEEEEAELYGGCRFRVADLGVRSHRVEREEFII